MRACPNCGVEVGVTADVCDSCGIQLTASPDVGSTQPADKAGASTSPPRQQLQTAPLAVEPELRQATILFCDLAGSTALSASLDPEDLREVLRHYQAAAVSVINKHKGFVSAYLGDGILVQFGYPRAHEDDPESAIRAGLEIATAVRGLRIRPELALEVRIGIATGLTVVGDMIGEGASREAAVVGRTPNLAARLQSVARPGEVIISDTTKRLAGTLFELVDLGKQNLKGFDEPVPAWRVESERPVENRFEASHAGSELGPLVGREVEYPALLEAWRQASNSKGQVVTIRGEPGLGKSRLSEALRRSVAAQAHLVLRYFCSPRFQNTALYPVMRWMQHAARLAEGDTDKMKLDKLEALLLRTTPHSELASTLPYIAALLSIPTGDRYPAIVDSAERQREQTLRALEAQILNLARDHPVLLIFEDLHWVDPTTLSSIDQLVRKIAQTPIMVLATGRPEFTPPWSELPHSLTVELSRLEHNDRTSIVQHHAGGKALPPEMLEHILQKSDGIPLFVEELTKAMMESGLLQEHAHSYALTGPMPALAVPSTLNDSLMARLDNLSEGKEVAQVGAAIGREFSYDMLAALLPLAPKELQATLSRLVGADLIYGRGTPPHAIYSFKHALIQDAAYATMLRARRRKLHAGIANILEADATTAKLEPEILAHHLTDAGMPARAIPHWQQAGLLASGRAAHTEACRHFDEGLRLITELPNDATRNGLELGLRVHLGVSLAAVRGYAAPEVEASYQRARELCQLIGDSSELYWVLRGLWGFYAVRADAKAARELADQCVRLGEETQRADFLIEGYTVLGYSLVYAGELRRGREVLTRAVEIYRTRDGAQLAYPTPQDPEMACLCMLALANWILGHNQQAVACMKDAITAAERSKRPFDAAFAHCYAANFENLRRNPQRAAHHAGIALEIAQRHGFAIWLAVGTLHLAIAKGALEQAQEAIGLLGATLTAWEAAGALLNASFFLGGLAESYRAAGDVDSALETVVKAIDHGARHVEHFYDAALYQLRGELHMMREGGAAHAEADFQHAIEIAQGQGAKMFELRGRTSLHAQCLKTGQAERSRPALEALCSELDRNGAEGTDLQEAQTLLRSSSRTRN